MGWRRAGDGIQDPSQNPEVDRRYGGKTRRRQEGTGGSPPAPLRLGQERFECAFRYPYLISDRVGNWRAGSRGDIEGKKKGQMRDEGEERSGSTTEQSVVAP
jgi:hypothetical protein